MDPPIHGAGFHREFRCDPLLDRSANLGPAVGRLSIALSLSLVWWTFYRRPGSRSGRCPCRKARAKTGRGATMRTVRRKPIFWSLLSRLKFLLRSIVDCLFSCDGGEQYHSGAVRKTIGNRWTRDCPWHSFGLFKNSPRTRHDQLEWGCVVWHFCAYRSGRQLPESPFGCERVRRHYHPTNPQSG